MYSSRLKTILDATVIVPNSEILGEKFVNWTHDRPIRMVEIPVGVHYESDLDAVQEVLYDAAKNTNHVLAEPEVKVLLTEFGDSSITSSPASGPTK